MKKVLIVGTVTVLAALAVACGGGTSSSDKTATAAAGAAGKPTTAATKAATAAATPSAGGTSEATPTTAELANYVTQLKGILQQVITKAQAGDLQGTKDTEATMDTAMEAIVNAGKAADPTLGDALEQRELAIEHEADASTTDLNVIATNAQQALGLIDQIAAKLNLSASTSGGATPAGTSEATPTKAELANYVTQLKGIMQQIIAKAQAGDVQGTRDTEATMDTAMEATVKATRAVDAALGDSLEKLELDIEAQADATNTDLSVIIKDAQAVLPILDQVVTALKLQ